MVKFKKNFGLIKKLFCEREKKKFYIFLNEGGIVPYPPLFLSFRNREAYLAKERKELEELKVLVEEWEKEAREKEVQNESKATEY